ncbi:MAG TPA: hypothetical protein VEG60_34325, partial [Candidatus Binatia bacterium]|nr:hypothetical protein [Candidatus Binatia bacterium]
QKMLSIVMVLYSPFSRGSTLEAHRERAYSPVEVGRWLMEASFTIRGVHDAATLRIATGCPQRIIVIAQKNLCKTANSAASARSTTACPLAT